MVPPRLLDPRRLYPGATQPASRALTIGLLGFTIFAVLVLDAAMVALPGTNHREVALYHTYRFLTFQAGTDSWEPMTLAWHHMANGGDAVYDRYFFNTQTLRFQYPPTSVLPFEAATRLSDSQIPSTPLNALAWCAVAVTGLCSALIFDYALTEYAPHYADVEVAERIFRGVLVVALTITFYPVAKAFSLGQAQTWIDALFALTLVFWLYSARLPAGVAVGLIALVKPQLGLLFVWAAIRREWRFALAAAATAATLGAVSIVLYGLSNHLQYRQVLAYMSRHGEAFYANQSVNGFLNRLLDNGVSSVYLPDQMAPYNVVVFALTLASSAILIGLALVWRRPSSLQAMSIDLALAALVFTMASPVAWDQHYGILPPIYALALPAMLRWQIFGRWSVPYLALSFLLTCNFYDATIALGDSPLLSPLESTLFAGALLLLVALYRLRAAADHEDATEFTPSTRRRDPVAA